MSHSQPPDQWPPPAQSFPVGQPHGWSSQQPQQGPFPVSQPEHQGWLAGQASSEQGQAPHGVDAPRPPGVEHDVPTWPRDFGRLVLYSLAITIVFTILVALAKAGVLRDQQLDVVSATSGFAGILLGVAGFLWPIMIFEQKRSDSGFRVRGLVPLMVVGTVLNTTIQALGLMAWPFILGPAARAGSMAAGLAHDPLALVTAFLFALASASWFSATFLFMIGWGPRGALIVLLPLLAQLGLFPGAGYYLFEAAPSLASLGIWALAAAAGLAALALAALFYSRAKRRRDAAGPYRPSLAELGWKPRS